MNTEGKVGWEEIVDGRLEGKMDMGEVNEVAGLAHKCINATPRKRPSMRDIVQVLSRILKSRHANNRHTRASSATPDEVSIHVHHLRDESIDSAADTYEP